MRPEVWWGKMRKVLKILQEKIQRAISQDTSTASPLHPHMALAKH